jgi:hypothetical protein
MVLNNPDLPPVFLGHYSINTIVELNLAAWFNTYGPDMLPGVQINVGQGTDLRSLPVVILSSESAHGHPDLGAAPLGNFEVTVRLYVYSSGDDELAGNPAQALELHRQRIINTESIMTSVDGLKAAWTNGELYACWFVSNEVVTAERRLGNVLTYNLVARYPEGIVPPGP